MKSQSTSFTTKVFLSISSTAIVVFFLILSSSVIEIKAQEVGCPALNASKCIEMNCQNLARNETVQCLDQSVQIPQGTIATYRCKGKSLYNETWNMMCICHGRWMGIQRYIKYNAWCEANNPAPFVEDKEPGALTQSESVASTSERGRILDLDTSTAIPVSGSVTVSGPLTETNTSTNPAETTLSSTNAPGTTVQLETSSTQPNLTGSTQFEGPGASTVPSAISTGTTPTTSEPSQQNGTTLPLESTTSQPNALASTTTPTPSENTPENLLSNNASQVPPEARSLFNDTSNTTAPPVELGSGVGALTTEASNGTGTTESPTTSVQQTSPAGINGEITTAGLTVGTLGTTTTLPSASVEFTTASTTTGQPQNVETTTTQLPGVTAGNGELSGSTTPSSILATTSQTEPVSSTPSTSFPIATTTAASITTTGSGSEPEEINAATTTPSSAAATTEAPVVTSSVGASISSEQSSPNFTDFQLVGLELHNKYRLAHNVSEVKLNQTLNEKAQSWAENQINEKTLKVTPGTRSYAENMYKVSGWKSITPIRAIQEAMKTWYSSINKYNWTEPNPTGFSQIVWKTTSDIGVGIAKKNDVTVVAVTYWPRGNIILVGENDNSTIDSGKLFRKNVFPKVLE